MRFEDRNRMTRQLHFKVDSMKKTGRFVTFYKNVLLSCVMKKFSKIHSIRIAAPSVLEPARDSIILLNVPKVVFGRPRGFNRLVSKVI